MDDALQARLFRWGGLGVGLAALWLRWPSPLPAWSHFDEIAFVVLPLGFWGGDLNPHYFNYPTFHFYLISLCDYLAWMTGWGAGVARTATQFVAYQYLVDGSAILDVARVAGVLLSTATVLVLALLGRRLFGPLAGGLAALALAVMPLATRFAPVANTDTPALFWTVLALLWATRARQSGVTRDALVSGLFVGLAAASKYPAVLIALPVAVALSDRWSMHTVRRVCLCAASALFAFSVASPYVWLDFVAFWHHFSDMAGTHMLAPTHTSGVPRLLDAAYFACGIGGLLAAAVGLVQAARCRTWQDRVVLSTGLVTVVLLLAARFSFLRYALPLAPVLCLLMARGLLVVRRSELLILLTGVVMLEPLYVSLASRQLLGGADTRTEARAWIQQQAPLGAWLEEPESACGRIDLLRPADVFTRQAHFLRSYGIDGLNAAYQYLATRPDLPALFPPGLPAAATRILPGTGGPQARMPALRLRYEHPICGPAEEAPRGGDVQLFDPLSAAASLTATDFDQRDWYFLPTRRLRHVRATGPKLTAQRRAQVMLPSVRSADFFESLSWITAAALAARQDDAETAIVLYERVLALWPRPDAVLGSRIVAGIHGQIERLQREPGR
jgi:4-amino-4-deoxy-L-arabinose transferase-like glycosyltransferase